MKVNLLKTSQAIFFITFLFLFSFNSSLKDTRKISGIVVDDESRAVEGAFVYSENTRKGAISDSNGTFEIIIPGKVKAISIEKFGFKTNRVELTVDTFYTITLNPSKESNKLIKGEYSLEKYPSSVLELKSDGISISPAPAKSASPDYEDIAYSESESAIGRKEMVSEFDSTLPKIKEKVSKEETSSKAAGQLTAGEWNDLKNWEEWNKLIVGNDYKEMGEYWTLRPVDRVSVFVTNQYELPIPDCVITLKSGGTIIWTARTDNGGKAELWLGEKDENLHLEVKSKENTFQTSEVKKFKDGANYVRFNEECNAPLNAEIMFVVDATGSMGDEIDFLKSEISDVIEQVSKERSTINFRWGSVFYRDNADEYLTRQSPLNQNKERIVNFINAQDAGGGGDYPEAVNEGLEEALMQDWSRDAIARIIFLVLDAPPHYTPEIISELTAQIEYAAAMGIKIIPITASGINRQTEYLMKFMSIMTNGTYVFLTDDSGIGNPHLDPIVKNYEVEKLNDLVIRLIKNYSDPGTCANQKNVDPIFANVEIFPNPAQDVVQVKIPKGVQKISLTTNSGQMIYSEIIKDQAMSTINLSGFVDGMYIVNLYTNETVYSYKVIKSNRA